MLSLEQICGCDMKHLRRLCVMGVAVLSLATSSVHAEAQWPPEKQSALWFPFPAGSTADVMMRLLAQEVSNRTSRTIIVENRPGGGAVIGTEAVRATGMSAKGPQQSFRHSFDPGTTVEGTISVTIWLTLRQ